MVEDSRVARIPGLRGHPRRGLSALPGPLSSRGLRPVRRPLHRHQNHDLPKMCGIAGIFGPGGADLEPIAAMIGTLAHRGPDGEGIWSDPEAGIALGTRRLAIIDRSDAGRQPMI